MPTAAPTASTFQVTRVRYQRDPRMDDLRTAVGWLAEHWNEQRTPPDKLHRWDTEEGELGGWSFTVAMERTLDWQPNDVVRVTMTTECRHPRVALPLGQREHGAEARWSCPDCGGSSVREISTDRFPFPMTTALARLAKVPGHRTQPHPVALLHALAARNWRIRDTIAAFGLPQETGRALLLRAIRKVHARYQAGPVHRSWIDLSESQRKAEEAAA